ncbi:hypothetical protein [Leptospira bandrabouensis]|uniref:hypothetical protein n=1 Tax=Leptospira bandrabouensis TaxID=2484903 RepID=UPI001EE8FB0D|nr:hypothetical protein [Leptospira bandrabouensis]MCG6143930.1 hypothetical protein [Leptospira bandrabouensis]MCG6159591.1 hypothetical protein [Leptospira bandrabouensis]MCG6163524.1 hypothetical protein [Leptospira bandrabouensis]
MIRILIFLLIFISTGIFAQESKEYKLSDKAYGLAWDGVNFWYIDTNRRAIIKINEIGEQEIFNLGLANLRGISFDTREGKLLVVAPKQILKLDPNSGGITDKIQIPISNVAGIASVGNYYYILDLDSGKVQIYDQSSSLMIGGFFTDRTRPRDICYGRDSLWISDSADNSIYRYDTKTGKITGSIKTNLRSIRGVLLSGSKLWVVDRENKEIKNIPFIETERFIASGEEEYNLEVSLKFKLDSVSLSKAQIAILHPPSNEQQRIRAVKFTDGTYQPSFIQRNRVHLKKLSIEDLPGEQIVKYKFSSKNQFIKYYVTDEYLDKEATYPNDVTAFYEKTNEELKLLPRDYLDAIYQARQTSISLNDFKDKMKEMGVPIQPFRMIRFEKGKPKSIQDSVSIFLLSYGWIPIADLGLGSNTDKRYFEKKETDLILFQSLNSKTSISPVYFRKDANSEWENLPAEITYKIK